MQPPARKSPTMFSPGSVSSAGTQRRGQRSVRGTGIQTNTQSAYELLASVGAGDRPSPATPSSMAWPAAGARSAAPAGTFTGPRHSPSISRPSGFGVPSYSTPDRGAPTRQLDPAAPPPCVFQCKQCGHVVGDSNSFVAVGDHPPVVVLTAAPGVHVSSARSVVHAGPFKGTSFRELICANPKCGQTDGSRPQLVGRMYCTTTQEMDAMRKTFSLFDTAVSAYQLGSGHVDVGEGVSGMADHMATVALLSERVAGLETDMSYVVEKLAEMQRYFMGMPPSAAHVQYPPALPTLPAPSGLASSAPPRSGGKRKRIRPTPAASAPPSESDSEASTMLAARPAASTPRQLVHHSADSRAASTPAKSPSKAKRITPQLIQSGPSTPAPAITSPAGGILSVGGRSASKPVPAPRAAPIIVASRRSSNPSSASLKSGSSSRSGKRRSAASPSSSSADS